MQKNSFRKNVVTLMTGTTIAQAIPIVISPILTRIYTPSDFGLLSLFLAITVIFASIISFRYELAIVLPKKDENALNIVALSLIITTLFSFILFIIIIIFDEYFIALLGNKDIGMWLYFIPISVFGIGLFNILSYFNIRKTAYRNISNAKIIKSIVASIIQIVIGLIKPGVSGLILGQIISNFSANLKLIKTIVIDYKKYKLSKLKILALLKRYKDFPKFSMWSILANKLAYNLNDILISLFYSITTLGYYSIVQRVLGLPSAFIGSAVGQVFLQKATEERKSTGKTDVVFISTVIKMLIIAFPFFIFTYIYIESLFSFVFGSDWEIAGTYAEILVPFFFFQFIVSSVSTVEVVMEKQKIGLIFNLLFLVICLSVMFFCQTYRFELYLKVFTVLGSIAYFLYGYFLYLVSKNFFK